VGGARGAPNANPPRPAAAEHAQADAADLRANQDAQQHDGKLDKEHG